MLHIFCATAAAAGIALSRGISKVSCLDIDLEIARKNLREYNQKKIEFIEREAFDYFRTKGRNDKYDLVVVEPYFHQVEEVWKYLVPTLLERSRVLLMNFGPYDQETRFLIDEEELKKYYQNITIRNRKKFGGMTIVVCESKVL